METIKELITKKAIEKKYFFTFKDENEIKKILRLLLSVGFKWNGGKELNDKVFLSKALGFGAINIEPDGSLVYGSVPSYLFNDFKEKNIFELFENLGLVASRRVEDFDIDKIDCFSSIKTQNGYVVRILAKDLKSKKPIVVACQDSIGNEGAFTVDRYGVSEIPSYDLIIENDYLEYKCVEMTVKEIEKALGITNLKIVE